MKIGLQIPNFTFLGGPAELRDKLARLVEPT